MFVYFKIVQLKNHSTLSGEFPWQSSGFGLQTIAGIIVPSWELVAANLAEWPEKEKNVS